jgi:aminoglycoside/choline kinase family phosphotransferase
LARRRPFDPAGFRRGFDYCALARNLQILGAFGFLSTRKGKPQFARYIPTALHSLEARLRSFQPLGFPKLQRWTELAIEKLGCP